MSEILVLGMHRSGTSAVTRILALMGCHLGAEGSLVAARPDNPSGFWERRDVYHLNTAILAALGADWDTATEPNPEALPQELTGRFVEAAAAIVAELEPPWAIKDPRLCLTLPLWRRVATSPVIVVVHRSPLEIARSLATRDGLELELGCALWEVHARALLRHSADRPRVLVHHADLLARPVAVSRQLRADLTAAGVAGLTDPEPVQIEDFIDPGLFRARGTAAEESKLLNPEQQSLLHAFASPEAMAEHRPGPISKAARAAVEGHRQAVAGRRRIAAAELAAEHDELFLEKNQLLAEQDCLLAKQDSLFQEKNRLLAKSDQSHEQKNRAETERDSLFAEKNSLLRKLEVAEQGSAQLLDEKAASETSARQIAADRDSLFAEKNEYLKTCEQLQQSATELAERIDRLTADQEALAAEVWRLEANIEELRGSRRYRIGSALAAPFDAFRGRSEPS